MAAIEATKKIPPDMEMFLPKTSNTANWLLENFDKTEIPKMDNLPLPDELTDIIGALQKEQEDLADKVQGAASNQLMKAMQQGGPIDGRAAGRLQRAGQERQPEAAGHRAERPFGRRARGREQRRDGRQGGRRPRRPRGPRAPHERRHAERQRGRPQRQGRQRQGDRRRQGQRVQPARGHGRRRALARRRSAPRQAANSALAAAQALLAEKTSKKAAQAALLYLRSDKLQGVAGIDGGIAGGAQRGAAGGLPGAAPARSWRSCTPRRVRFPRARCSASPRARRRARTTSRCSAAGEGEAPAPYKDRVADYYRSLAEREMSGRNRQRGLWLAVAVLSCALAAGTAAGTAAESAPWAVKDAPVRAVVKLKEAPEGPGHGHGDCRARFRVGQAGRRRLRADGRRRQTRAGGGGLAGRGAGHAPAGARPPARGKRTIFTSAGRAARPGRRRRACCWKRAACPATRREAYDSLGALQAAWNGAAAQTQGAAFVEKIFAGRQPVRRAALISSRTSPATSRRRTATRNFSPTRRMPRSCSSTTSRSSTGPARRPATRTKKGCARRNSRRRRCR